MVVRDERLNIRLSAEELTKLKALAEHAGISASDWIRLRIREAPEPPKPKRPKK